MFLMMVHRKLYYRLLQDEATICMAILFNVTSLIDYR